MTTWLDDVRARLTAAGLDVTHAFDAACLAALTPPVPTLGRAHPQALLVGNSRALWPLFVARADAHGEHPLDRYVEASLDDALAGAPPHALLLGHVPDDDHGFWPLQRQAAAAGLGRLAPSHLLIHPTLGPWLALRALVVFDADATWVDELPPPPPCDCARGCEVALVHAQQARGEEAWRAWLAVRDACPVGAQARYGEDQILHHYTHAGSLLRRRRPVGPVPTLD
ncbi:MAG: hypothetical protein R2939_09775 [Kofleriaceae bacterium]